MRNALPAVVALVIGCLCLLAPADAAAEKEARAKVKKISIEEFEEMKEEENTVILDVRSAEEFEAGHVPGAVNVPINADDFDQQLEALDKNRTYLVHCAKGIRSGRATGKMRGSFKSLYDFPGGFEAWKAAGKPVEKAEE